ncbi:hypothetical protein CDCA_CDCA04G1161 [Cyanidium caldarium]|uniref:Uncharacterized protein n=1 Tax=Cyanidium caldarium TaxID=2771 RepID=A0AAV9ISU9_CYACA|nr:hypothetical protein CDCA_CDCA04G1161 [Cyanidium caldarium]
MSVPKNSQWCWVLAVAAFCLLISAVAGNALAAPTASPSTAAAAATAAAGNTSSGASSFAPINTFDQALLLDLNNLWDQALTNLSRAAAANHTLADTNATVAASAFSNSSSDNTSLCFNRELQNAALTFTKRALVPCIPERVSNDSCATVTNAMLTRSLFSAGWTSQEVRVIIDATGLPFNLASLNETSAHASVGGNLLLPSLAKGIARRLQSQLTLIADEFRSRALAGVGSVLQTPANGSTSASNLYVAVMIGYDPRLACLTLS